MPRRDPHVRLAAARDTLDFLDARRPGTRAAVLAEFPAESRDLFENAPRTTWLSIEHDRWVVEGTMHVLGEDTALALWRSSVLDIVESPLLRSFVSGMLRVFGAQRHRVVGLLPKAWPQVYRDFCDLSFETGRNEATLVFEQVADRVWDHPGYFVSWRAACLGALDLANLHGDVDFETQTAARRAVAHFSWSTEGAS